MHTSTLGWVINTYPRGSHSFIWREIHAIERQHGRITRFAARRPDPADGDNPVLAAEQAATTYLLDGGPRSLAGALARASRPAALRLARARAAAGESPLAQQLAYLAQAQLLKERCAVAGIDHLHAHFGTNPARVAAYCRMLGGPTYSLTIHGPEEFDRPQALDLRGKIAGAAFAVAVSQYGRSQLMRWVAPEHWDRLHVVHCGIDTAAFANPPGLPGSEPRRLVAVGRFSEQKGFGLLIRAFSRAVADRPDLHLTLVGDGELRPQIETDLCRAGLGDRVRLTGWLSPDAVRAELAAAHALVLPSFAEGLPVVIMEAMAQARPVLSTWVAGIPELVQPGRTGWLVAPGDADALARGMVAVADADAGDLAAMGQAGRDRVLRRHDVADSARRILDLIDGARSARSPAPRPGTAARARG